MTRRERPLSTPQNPKPWSRSASPCTASAKRSSTRPPGPAARATEFRSLGDSTDVRMSRSEAIEGALQSWDDDDDEEEDG